MSMLMDNPPTLVEHFLVSRKSVTSIAFNPTNHKQFAIASDDGTVTVFSIPQKGARTMKFDKKVLNEVYEIDWSKKNMIAAVGKEKIACVFECKLMSGYSDQFVAHQKSIRSVHFSNSANRVITASDDKTVKMWRLSERRPLATYSGHTNWIRSARFSPNNKFVASSSEDRVLRIFDADSGQLIHQYKDEKGFGNQIAWHKSSEFLSVAQENGRVKLYDLRAQKLIQYYRIFENGVNSLDFHSSGNFMITGCKDGTVKVLDLLEGRDIFTLLGHRDSVTSVKFSGDGEYFVTGSKDRHIMVWKSNLSSIEVTEDQENEAYEKLCLNEINHKTGDNNKRESILVDAKKSSVYKNSQEGQEA